MSIDWDEVCREMALLTDMGCQRCEHMATDRDSEGVGHWWLCGHCANRQAYKLTYLGDLVHRIWKDGLAPVLKEAHDAAQPADNPEAAAAAKLGREALRADRAKARAAS